VLPNGRQNLGLVSVRRYQRTIADYLTHQTVLPNGRQNLGLVSLRRNQRTIADYLTRQIVLPNGRQNLGLVSVWRYQRTIAEYLIHQTVLPNGEHFSALLISKPRFGQEESAGYCGLSHPRNSAAKWQTFFYITHF
jgi:hypothetical protein